MKKSLPKEAFWTIWLVLAYFSALIPNPYDPIANPFTTP